LHQGREKTIGFYRSWENNLHFYIKKCKILEWSWEENGAAWVQPWYKHGGKFLFVINCIGGLNTQKEKKRKEGKVVVFL
jgi:hypothetical protein